MEIRRDTLLVYRGFLPKILQTFSDTGKKIFLHEVKLTPGEIEPIQAQMYPVNLVNIFTEYLNIYLGNAWGEFIVHIFA